MYVTNLTLLTSAENNFNELSSNQVVHLPTWYSFPASFDTSKGIQWLLKRVDLLLIDATVFDNVLWTQLLKIYSFLEQLNFPMRSNADIRRVYGEFDIIELNQKSVLIDIVLHDYWQHYDNVW